MPTPIDSEFTDYPNRPSLNRQHNRFKNGRANKHTREQVREIRRVVRQLLLNDMPVCDIKKGLFTSYGLRSRMVSKYVARARQEIIDESDLPREVHIANSHHRYLAIMADPETDCHAKVKAQNSIDHLLGLPVPSRVMVADVTPQAPVGSSHLPGVRQRLIQNPKTRELLCQLCEAGNALDAPQAGTPEPVQALLENKTTIVHSASQESGDNHGPNVT